MVRTAFRARWLPRHVLALVLIAAMIFLGRWQWDVSESQRGSLQNLLYAFQWWVMAAMIGYGWWRLLRDDTYGRPAPLASTVAMTSSHADDDTWAAFDGGRAANALGSGGTSRLGADGWDILGAPDGDQPDDALADYNAYLLRLNARAERAR